MPRVGERPGLFLEGDAMNYIGGPGDWPPLGSKTIEQWPAKRTGFDTMTAEKHFREGRLPRTDRSDNGPGLALAQSPAEIAEDHVSARTDDRRVVEDCHRSAIVHGNRPQIFSSSLNTSG